MNGSNQFWRFNDAGIVGGLVPYAVVAGMIGCVSCQTHYLTTGLAEFDALYIIPVFQCVFITFSIAGGAIYFDELAAFSTVQWIAFLASVALTFFGVHLLSGREMHTKTAQEKKKA